MKPDPLRRRRIIRIIIPILVAVLAVIIVTGLYFFCSPPMPRKYSYNKGKNAAWARHQWFSEPMSDTDADTITRKLESMEIATIYLHVGPVYSDSSIPPYDPEIWKKNREKLKSRMPHLKILAWLGGLTSTKFGKAHDTLDMSDESLMKKIALLSKKMVESENFDGIHYDIEPLPNDDAGFLFLLAETRRVLGDNSYLSVAAPYFSPNDTVVRTANRLANKTIALWGPSYYRRVGNLCDEIAVMSYDSMTVTPASYRRFMINMVVGITNALADTNCRLLIGIPTYEDRTISHRPEVENVVTGLEGTVLGLERAPRNDIVDGVAIYALWTTDENEIKQYRSIWLQK